MHLCNPNIRDSAHKSLPFSTRLSVIPDWLRYMQIFSYLLSLCLKFLSQNFFAHFSFHPCVVHVLVVLSSLTKSHSAFRSSELYPSSLIGSFQSQNLSRKLTYLKFSWRTQITQKGTTVTTIHICVIKLCYNHNSNRR